MSSYRVKEELVPTDFLDLSYADKKEEPSKSETRDIEDVDNGGGPPMPDAPQYSPLSSPYRREAEKQEGSLGEHRGRSRSPVWVDQPSEFTPTEVVLEIYDEYGMPMQVENTNDVFLAPDAHTLFVSPEENAWGEANLAKIQRSGRRGNRSVGRRGSLRARGQFRSSKEGHRWELGDPLNEIWLTDEDVPAEFLSLGSVILSSGSRMPEGNEHKRKRPKRRNDSDEEDDGVFTAAKHTSHFEWFPMETFQGREETFLPQRTGAARKYRSAYDAFRSYWDDDIISLIVNETNQYASKITSSHFQAEWYDTNSDEILCLFAFWMMLGIVRMPTLSSCFSSDPLLKTEVFKRIFTRSRLTNLTRALHFVNVDPASNNKNLSNTDASNIPDRLQRLRPILLHLNAKFQSNYKLDRDICIDESLTLWKGKLDIKQYIKMKASKYGIQTFELCESTTGYLWSFIVYTGKQSSIDLQRVPGVPVSTAVVKKLMTPLLNKGHRLFMDNFYNSPDLARFLKRHRTDCVGTLRPSRRHVPFLVNEAPLRRGEIIARHSGDVTVLAWQDKKRITMISTCHGSSFAQPRVPSRKTARPVPFKPNVVLDYNVFMGGVDLKDTMLEPYLLERKRCTKWYMKLFKRLLNVSILNSRILLESSINEKQDHLAFRLQLVDSILNNHLPHCPQSRKIVAMKSKYQELGRLNPCAHWPTLLEQTEAGSDGNRNRRKRCVVCLREGRKSIRTTFCCETCLVPLCIQDCFKKYHTST